MAIRIGVADAERMAAPRIISTILPFAIQTSLETPFVFESANAAMDGRMAVNKTMFTPARKDSRRPA